MNSLYRFVSTPSSTFGLRNWINKTLNERGKAKQQNATPYRVSIFTEHELHNLFNESDKNAENNPIFMNELLRLRRIPVNDYTPDPMKQLLYYQFDESPLFKERSIEATNTRDLLSSTAQHRQYLHVESFGIPEANPVPTQKPAKIIIGVPEVYILLILEFYIHMKKTDALKYIPLAEDSPVVKQQLYSIYNELLNVLVPKDKLSLFRETIAPIIVNTLDCFNYMVISTLSSLPYPLLFHNRVSHLGSRLNEGLLHHVIYLENSAIVEVNWWKYPFAYEIKSGIGINSMFNFLRNTARRLSPVILYEYEDAYATESLKLRSLWSLGLIDYKMFRSNCENLPNWVFQNDGGACRLEIPNIATMSQVVSDDFRAFWSLLLEEDRRVEWFSRFSRGGNRRSRRRRYRLKKRKTLRR